MQVAVISQSMAKHYWEGQDPVGRRISFDNGKHWITIVGIVGDVKQYGLDHPAQDTIYRPITQSPGGRSLSVKTTAEPTAMARLVIRAIRELDPEQAIVNVKTLDEVRGESVATTRITAALLASFAVLALIIAATGLAGVISFLVTQRTREIGIRMALGAQTSSVLRMVLKQGMTLAGAGLLLGVVGALIVTRVLQTYLFGVTRTDALTFATVALVLGGAAALATYLPARRAVEVDPVVALRCD
jgi:putative ABC transport system permease protein